MPCEALAKLSPADFTLPYHRHGISHADIHFPVRPEGRVKLISYIITILGAYSTVDTKYIYIYVIYVKVFMNLYTVHFEFSPPYSVCLCMVSKPKLTCSSGIELLLTDRFAQGTIH